MKNNPYLQSKLMWNDLYGDIEDKLRFSRIIIVLLSILLTITLIAIIVLSLQSKIRPIPFIIHGNEVLLSIDKYNDFNSIKPKLSLLLLRNFVQNARTVTVDKLLAREYQIAAFSFTQDMATQNLRDFYQQQNNDKPLSKTIKITSILKKSPYSVTVRWNEYTYAGENSNKFIKNSFIANLHFIFGKISNNNTILRYNPFGFYIDRFDWSKEKI